MSCDVIWYSCWLSTDNGFIWSFIVPVIFTLTVRTLSCIFLDIYLFYLNIGD